VARYALRRCRLASSGSAVSSTMHKRRLRAEAPVVEVVVVAVIVVLVLVIVASRPSSSVAEVRAVPSSSATETVGSSRVPAAAVVVVVVVVVGVVVGAGAGAGAGVGAGAGAGARSSGRIALHLAAIRSSSMRPHRPGAKIHEMRWPSLALVDHSDGFLMFCSMIGKPRTTHRLTPSFVVTIGQRLPSLSVAHSSSS